MVDVKIKLSESLDLNYSKIKSEVVKKVKRVFDDQDYEATYLVPLGTIGNNKWAIVIAWMDYDNNNWEVFGKVAYQPKNSIMQEYDIDWTMPYDEETGEVYNTETVIPQNTITQSVSWLTKQWEWISRYLLKEEDMEESVKNNKKSLMTEEKFNALVLEYMLEENCTIQEAMALAEDTITPEMIDAIETTPAYRKLKKEIEYYFKAVDGIDGYRDGDFKDGPIDALQGEADFCKDTADFLGSLRFKGFKPEQQKELMNDTVEDMEYLDRSALRLTNILKKQDDSMYLTPDGEVNKKTSLKPGEYARRALRALKKLFSRLGQDFAYDIDFDYSSLPDVDYKNYVLDSKNWKNGIKNTIHTAMTEGITDKQILLDMGKDLKLNEEQLDYYNKYVYYMME